MARLYLVRHGNIKLNEVRRFWGKTDVELDEEGIRQAEALRDRISRYKIDAVYTSTLKRTRATAEVIAAEHHTPITACPELNEINFGFFEGLSFDEIKKQNPDLAKTLNVWNSELKFPGGEGFTEFNDRILLFLQRLKSHKDDEAVLIVSHAGPLRLIICNLLEINTRHGRQLQIDFGSLSIVEMFPEGCTLSLLNDISHIWSL
jgi:alpha-ribazole phosphatase